MPLVPLAFPVSQNCVPIPLQYDRCFCLSVCLSSTSSVKTLIKPDVLRGLISFCIEIGGKHTKQTIHGFVRPSVSERVFFGVEECKDHVLVSFRHSDCIFQHSESPLSDRYIITYFHAKVYSPMSRIFCGGFARLFNQFTEKLRIRMTSHGGHNNPPHPVDKRNNIGGVLRFSFGS